MLTLDGEPFVGDTEGKVMVDAVGQDVDEESVAELHNVTELPKVETTFELSFTVILSLLEPFP